MSSLLKYSQTQYSFTKVCSSLFPWTWDLGFPKAGLTSKEGIQYNVLFQVLCKQVSHFIQQWTHAFPRFPFVRYVLTEALLAVFNSPCQIQFQLVFQFANLS